MIVVDTNVISELMRPEPDPRVLRWVRAQRSGELRTTSITVAEIRYGIERLPDGLRKGKMLSTVEELFAAFGDSVFSFDATAAEAYARIVSGVTAWDFRSTVSTPRLPLSARPAVPMWRQGMSKISGKPESTSSTRGASPPKSDHPEAGAFPGVRGEGHTG